MDNLPHNTPHGRNVFLASFVDTSDELFTGFNLQCQRYRNEAKRSFDLCQFILYRSETYLIILEFKKIEAKQTLHIQELKKHRSEAKSAY